MKKKQAAKRFTFLIILSFVMLVVFGLLSGFVKVSFLNISHSANAVSQYKVLLDPTEVSVENLKNQKAVLLFSSSWCGACNRTRSLIFNEIESHPDVVFYEADVEAFRKLANDLEVHMAPAVVIINNNEVEVVNGSSESELSSQFVLLNK